MKNSDMKEFNLTLAMMFDLFDKEITVPKIEIYWDSLKQFTIGDVCIAIRKACENNIFLPKPVQIKSYLVKDDKNLAMDAWLEVLAEIKRVGCQDATASDQVIKKAVLYAGGWHAIGMAKEKEIQFLQNKFIDGFLSYKKQCAIKQIENNEPNVKNLIGKV